MSIGLRDYRRNALSLVQSPSKFDIDAFRLGGRPKAFDDSIRDVFLNEWTAIGRALRNCVEKIGELSEHRPGTREYDAGDNVRFGTVRESGDLDWNVEIRQRNPAS